MDGLSLAASIIQLLDVASRIISKGVEIYDSVDGQLIDHTELQSVTKILRSSAQQLNASVASKARHRTRAEVEQESLGTECQKVAKELLDALNALKVQGRFRRWKSFRQALKTVWREDKIAGLEKRLDRYRQQMILSIIETLRTQTEVTAAQQATILESIHKAQRRQDDSQRSQIHVGRSFFTEMRDLIDGATKERWRKELIDTIHRQPQQRTLRNIQGQQKKEIIKVGKRLIRNLKFEGMEDRQLRIAEAQQETFHWVYLDPRAHTRPWASFRDFLEEEENRLYWITGKPGSGKSTLMKYLNQNDRTLEHLKRWSPKNLITSHFYFWNSGADMQMSIEGLLRSLLAQCLSQLPHSIVPRLFPARWEVLDLFGDDYTTWTWQELARALWDMILDICSNRRFFFLIDGLDEFSGDHAMLTDLILKLVSTTTNVKVCIASRPWSHFEDAFRGKPHLMLHDLTTDDIAHFIQSKFQESPGFLEFQVLEPFHSKQLLIDLARKAEGVFLWVWLVTRSLLVEIANGDSISELRKTLDSLPSDLEKLYRKLLESIEPGYLHHASQLLQIHRAARKPPTLLNMAFAYLNVPHDSLPLSKPQITTYCKTMKRVLYSRCKGLLEIEASHGPNEKGSDSATSEYSNDENISNYDVQYLHRTVRDFITRADIWDWILTESGQRFDPYVALSKSYLLRIMADRTLPLGVVWSHAMWCIDYAKESELRTGFVQTDLLGKLRSAIEVSCARKHNIASENEGSGFGRSDQELWDCSRIPAAGTSFMYLMAMCGMSGYLHVKLGHDDLELGDHSDDKSPLLFAVVEDYLLLNQYDDRKSIAKGSPCLETLRVLLRKGADPDQVFRGRSPKSIALAMTSQGDREFLEVNRLLKKFGKRPTKRNDRSDPRRKKSTHRSQKMPSTPGANLTLKNLLQHDPTHGAKPQAELQAQKGSDTGKHLVEERHVKGRGFIRWLVGW